MRAILIVLCLMISAWVAHFCQPYVGGDSDLRMILVTVFTVFAGFLVAVVTIIGDPSLLPDGSWRSAEIRRETIELRLIAQMYLFILYLLAIVFLIAGAVLEKVPATVVSDAVKIWTARAYLFFGTASLLFTFGLARSIFALQLARIDAEIAKRRRSAGLDGGDKSKKT